MFGVETSDSAALGVSRWRLLLHRFTRVVVRCPFCERLAPTAYVHSSHDGHGRVYWRCSGGDTHRWPASSFVTAWSSKGRIVGRSPWVR